jgi:hypothetical protein
MEDTLKISLKNEKFIDKNNETMSIDLREIKPSSNVNLTDFVEIKTKYLKLLKNTWIKYRDDEGNFYSGGFLIEISEDYICLRNIQQKIFNIDRKSTVFYCKNNTENYLAVQGIIIENQKLSHERYLLNHERIKFEQEKKDFLKKIQTLK